MEESYEERGRPKDEAERRARATVTKESGGGDEPGSGRGKADMHDSLKTGGKEGGEASAHRSAADRSASAKAAAATRKRNVAGK
ncbi:plasmid stabilization protein [Sphingomonas aracearum]|uniref:plasmid stabilization protein n=1 Tax=Sphingomonas aracearum TaxID=2283317 RepID=UPI001EF01C93|nr:plasmid stabilization protein [Sphingomonas aracearum]